MKGEGGLLGCRDAGMQGGVWKAGVTGTAVLKIGVGDGGEQGKGKGGGLL